MNKQEVQALEAKRRADLDALTLAEQRGMEADHRAAQDKPAGTAEAVNARLLAEVASLDFDDREDAIRFFRLDRKEVAREVAKRWPGDIDARIEARTGRKVEAVDGLSINEIRQRHAARLAAEAADPEGGPIASIWDPRVEARL